MKMMAAALAIVSIWAVVDEIRFHWLLKKVDELTDLTLDIGHYVVDQAKAAKDDGR